MAKLDLFLPKNKGTISLPSCQLRVSIVNNDTAVVLPFNSQKQTRQEKRKKINLIWLTSAVSSLKLNQFTYGGCHRCSFPGHNLKDKRLKKKTMRPMVFPVRLMDTCGRSPFFLFFFFGGRGEGGEEVQDMLETELIISHPHPRRLEFLSICRRHSNGSTFSSVILRP